jgi:glucoamylase
MGVPWCFYPSGSNPCEDINYSYDGGASFDSNFYNKMYALYEANINIQSKGGVVASPDKNTPGGSYYFHWMRDAGLTMRAYMELNDMNLSKVQDKMKAYTEFVLRTQSETSPYGDVRINPKFELPNGEVYQGGWCRPQTDGPGLSSGALIMFGNLLLDAGQDSYVYQNLWTKDGSKNGGAIKYDLDWVVSNWQSDGCDLWEEVRSNDFFWNRMAFAYTLGLASKFATRVGDSNSASKYESTKSAIEATLDSKFMINVSSLDRLIHVRKPRPPERRRRHPRFLQLPRQILLDRLQSSRHDQIIRYGLLPGIPN